MSNYQHLKEDVQLNKSKRGGSLKSSQGRSTLELEGSYSPPGGATAYQLLRRSINRQVANRVAKNDTNLAVSPTCRCFH
ncbi:hypothetical protein TNCV_1088701 [Trichonephila clavipes]|uniref:Uncharacterized protein n=1 Tax=Trichonephila clavipes TaxID=2585209 RepID=A0A8X6VQD4_TRICX|nr:hypothetical protein TNCV_1088701 [Trichonephila clavipes]